MSLWSRAASLAERTPIARNRYVDFLRALSIGAVVVGHWLIAAPWFEGDRLHMDHMLGVQPWTQWLTLLFQVMPIFFLVGGYSNAASWDAAARGGRGYGQWLESRARRLVGPVVPLLAVWAAMAFVFRRFGVGPETVRVGSTLALVPLWFLAVYLMVVAFVPLTRAAWKRYGVASFWGLTVAAALVDVVRFWDGHRPGLAWINYLFVWLAVHQLGYLWRDGRLAGPRRALPWAVAGAMTWILLVRFGPYPISMVGVPGEEISNTLPPDLLLLALGMAQTGLLLAVERLVRRWLDRPRIWTATVLVNGVIMSVYLWHLTVLVLLVGLSALLGGIGLGLAPGSPAWWASRPLWFVALGIGLLAALPLVARFERTGDADPARPHAVWRILSGAVVFCAALALIALGGVGSDSGLGIRVGALALALTGALLLGVLPLPGRRPT